MPQPYDIVCLSHLRWNFVYQRPQHLLSRCAADHRVFFIEEPDFLGTAPRLVVRQELPRLWVVQPVLPAAALEAAPQVRDALQRELLDQFIATRQLGAFVLWYYTPLALSFTEHLLPRALATVYDCMDELSAFKGASPRLAERGPALLARADLVFAGGQSLYAARQREHPHVFCFPSSVDQAHFGQARRPLPEPPDQQSIARPRIGFYGVLDERLDLELLAILARRRPDWQFVLVGPTAKISPADLPRAANLHYLGQQPYAQLPAYLSGWDVALLPFARNAATRFISPTKTLEYLAAGKPVVSTPIADVVQPYGDQGLVRIAATAREWETAIEDALAEPAAARLPAIDAVLAGTSWDRTWAEMARLIDAVVAERVVPAPVGALAASGDEGGSR